MEKYFKELPMGYKEVKVIDAKDKKTITIFNIVAIFMMIVAFVPFLVLKPLSISNSDLLLPFPLIMILGMVLYIILHELTHGLAYKIFTKQKLTFGITIFVAFCGVPHIYVSKKVALIAVLAPFVVFSTLLIPILIIIPANLIYLALVIIFSIHFSGCVGDLYVTYVLLKLKDDVLMNDTGPKQTFYILDKTSIL
jgi:hypothetical protein